MMTIILMAGAFSVSQADLDSALEDAGGNRPELERALKEAGELREQAGWLIVSMPHLDRLEMTAEVLLEHLRIANEDRGSLPDTIFRDYILSYRIYEEPCEAWRGELRGRFQGYSPQEIRDWIADSIAPDTGRYFFGPFPSPLTILGSRRANEKERCVLLVAALRARGVPARLARCPWPPATWVEFYDHEAWKPLFFKKPEGFTITLAQKGFGWVQTTDRYAETGTLSLSFTRNGKPDTSFQDFSVQVWAHWHWEALDDLWWPREGDTISGSWNMRLAPGEYLLVWARRNPKGEPFVRTQPLRIEAGKTLPLTVETNIPSEDIDPGDLMVRRLDSLPRIRLASGEDLADRLEYPCLVAFLGDDEGSFRTEKQLSALRVFKVWTAKKSTGMWLPADSLMAQLGIKMVPSVILLDERGRPVLWTEGFQEGLLDYIKNIQVKLGLDLTR